MRKIRIAFVETNCKKNGPIKQTLNIIRHMDRVVFEPMLITVWPEENGNSMLDEYRQLDIQFRTCGLSRKASIVKGRTAVGRFLEEFKADIVQAVGIPPYRMTLGYREAIHLVTLRNYCYEDYPDQYGKLIGPILATLDMGLIRKQMKCGEPFVTCSQSLSTMYKQRQGLTFNFIRNGVDVSKYRKREAGIGVQLREKLGLPHDKVIFTYTGRLIDRKNQREAIEAFQKMRRKDDAVLLLLGDGADMERLQSEFGNNTGVFMPGAVSNVEEYLHASDIYLATSKSEGLPNGVLEAMACGLPVLLSDIPQHLEVLEAEERCGMAYKLGNVTELAEKMDMLLGMDLCMMGDLSYEAVQENFTAEIMSKRYQQLYRSLCKQNEKP